MKKQIILICLFFAVLNAYTQETTATYKEAINILKQTEAFKELKALEFTAGSQSVSFTNLAYAFWLEGMDTRFKEKNFENFYGDLYIPIEIKKFKAAKEKKRATIQLYASETEKGMFIIELLISKKKRKAKYPKFYNGKSIAFLFEKRNGSIFLVDNVSIQNN